jgi:hypothetical protein
LQFIITIIAVQDSIDDLSATTPEVGRRKRQASPEEAFSTAGEGDLTFLTQVMLQKLPQILVISSGRKMMSS